MPVASNCYTDMANAGAKLTNLPDGDLLARFFANVFRLAIAARCSWRMLCFLAATKALPASETGPQWEPLGVSKRSIEAKVLL